MPRNIEIKARIESVEALAAVAGRLAGAEPATILQDDTFFPCPNGRLKLRAFPDGDGELIFYQREDTDGPKQSFYVITPTADPDGLRQTLTLAYGQAGRVRKRRLLYRLGRTRLHLDRVEGLGDFLELEVVLADEEPLHVGEDEAKHLLKRLGLRPGQLVAKAYVDLLEERG